MPQVKFEKQISLSSKDTFEKLKSLLNEASELKKIDPEIVLTVEEENMCVIAKGAKINGEVSVVSESSDSSIVKVDLNIPWTYAPFKSIITAKLEEKISELC
jgi:septum formation topological specificity factor MinE